MKVLELMGGDLKVLKLESPGDIQHYNDDIEFINVALSDAKFKKFRMRRVEKPAFIVLQVSDEFGRKEEVYRTRKKKNLVEFFDEIGKTYRNVDADELKEQVVRWRD